MQGDLAGHGHITAHRDAGQAGHQRRGQGDTGRRAVLGYCALRGVDVQVAFLELFRVDAVLGGVHAHPRNGQLSALLHHVAQRTGDGDLAAAVVHHLHLDGQGLAAHAGPCQTVGDAHRVGAVEEVGLDKAGAKQLFQHGAGNGDAFHLACGDLAGALAQHAGDGAFQIAHTGLAGVAVDDAVQRALAQRDLAGQAAGLELLGQQVLAGNVVFFHAGVAGQLDHVHAVTQGAGDAAKVVGGGDKEHMAQIERDIDEMIVEGAVLLRVQRFQQGCGRVAAEVACQLVDLVQQHEGVRALGRDHGSDDLAGHRADVGAAVAADLGFIPHAAKADAHILAAQTFGDGACNTGLAHARRAYKADDLCLHVRCQLAHGQRFQNAVLHLFQAVVVAVQNLLCAADIKVIHCKGVPRQVKAGVQIGADDRCLLIGALHLGKTVHFLEQLLLAVLGKVQAGDPAAVLVGLGVGVIALAQLVADDVQLFVQVVIALVLVHGLVDLFRDLLFNFHHLTLTAQHLNELFQPSVQGALVHHSLLVLVAEQQVCGHVLAEEGGVVAGNDGKHHVLAKARVHAKVLVKPGLEGAQQRFGLHGIVGLACAHRGRAHLRKQKIAAGIQCTELCAVLALHQDLYKVPGDAQHLLDLGHHAVAEQVCLLRLGGVHGLLCHQKHVGIICHCPLHGGNALFAAHLKVDEIVGEHHQPAQGDGGQMQLFALHLDGNFFTHSANTSRLPRTFPRRQRCMQEILSLK